MKKCKSKHCTPICDNCSHYDFNGDDGVYTGDGWCQKHHEASEPYMECTDFECFLAGDDLATELHRKEG